MPAATAFGPLLPPEIFERLLSQPPEVEFSMPDGIFIKQMHMKAKDSYVPQHSHKYDHTSMIATGAVRLWCDGILMGDFKAPKAIEIKAGCKHLFQTLEPDTIIYCIHNISRTGEVEVLEEHQIT